MYSRGATPADLEVIASWIGSQRECELWAGPDISYPLEPHELATQIGMAGAMNVALDDELGLAAFGQALVKSAERVHLARVIVRPAARGHGVGRSLIKSLLSGARESGFSLVTLNVYSDNAPAVALYTGLGFCRVARPEGDPPLPAAWFMQRSIEPRPAGTGGFSSRDSTEQERG